MSGNAALMMLMMIKAMMQFSQTTTLFRHFVFIIPLSVALTSQSFGATYYVAPNGNNSANGSIGSPWDTLEYATSRMSGGDTLYVRGGTYNEVFDLYGPDGTAANPTIIRNYPGETPVFDNGNPSGSAHALYGVNWYVLSGLTIRNIGLGLIVWETCSNVVLTNLTVYNTGHQSIFIYQQSHHIQVLNSVIHGAGVASNGEGLYIGCNDFVDNTHDITIRGNTIYDTSSEGIELKPGTYNCVVENNTLYTCNKGGGGFGAGGGCIEVDENSDVSYYNGNANHIIRGNRIYDTVIGIRMARGGRCYNNIIYGASESGIEVNTDFGPDDGFVRYIYNNTVDLPSSKAVVRTAGTASILNNIGPTGSYNLAVNSAYFANMAAHDYHLVAGSAPINAGTNVASLVTIDFDGQARPSGLLYDVGAYEYGGVLKPLPPQNLKVISSP